MAKPRSFQLYELDGKTPKLDADPTFAAGVFRTRALVDRAAPGIVHLGGGKYGHKPTDADELAGVVFMTAEIPNALPSRVFGTIHRAHEPFHAALFEDQAGALWTGPAATLAEWLDPAGASPAPPGLVAIEGSCLFAVTAPAAELAVGRHYRIDGAPNALPASYDDDLYFDTSTPNIVMVDPAVPGDVAPADTITFDVTDNALRKVIVIVKFTPHSLWEVIHDGDGFSPGYTGSSTRTAITNGFRFVANRAGGWPAGAFQLKVVALDVAGNEGI